jgi:serine protease Do
MMLPLLALALLPLAPARADRPAPAVRVDASSPVRAAIMGGFAEVAAKAAPSVVSIVSDHGRDGGGLGSGVIVSPDGFILTNGHLVAKSGRITVSVPGRGSDFRARVVGIDPKTDVAVLKIEGEDFPAAVFADSAKLAIGDVVLAIGSPFGIGQTVTMGIVSAVSRGNIGIEDYEDFIQTDAAINPGNSGGALVDVQGRLVGINTAILSPTGGSLGIGFAVPANLVRSVMDSLARRGKVVRGYLGAVMQDLTPGLARRFGVEEGGGALVGEITPGGPAEKAGLRPGDVVVKLAGKPVLGSSPMRLAVTQLAPGSKVPIEFVRDGRRSSATAVLGLLPDDRDAAAPFDEPSRTLEGLSLYDLTPDVGRKLGTPPGLNGALVVEIEPGSGPWRAGLRPGDVIVEIERRSIRSAAEAETALNRASASEALVRLWTRGSFRYAALPRKEIP